MNRTHTKPEKPPQLDAQEISKWTRAYAQNRGLGVVVFMIIFLALSAAIGGPSYLAGQAYRSGNMPLFWLCVAVLVLALGALIYLSVPKWGGKLQQRVIASVAIDFVIDIPYKYTQPISAIYVVPFLVGLWFLMRPMAGPAALLWPALYAIHAILIVAGAPIVFTHPWDGLNVLIPTAGYGILSGLVSHFYSRIALHRLKRLAQIDPAAADQSQEVR